MPFLSRILRRTSIFRCICQQSGRRSASSAAQLTRSALPASHTLPKGPARTRFAPSPTGYLHLGSLRTALFNFLLSKSTGGQFLLRIEDTDQKRTIPGAEDRLCQDLEWAGLQWDEGPKVGGPYGPYKQSQRTALYREHSEILLKSGHAYRCFCTPERLRALAETRVKLGLPSDYDRACTHVSSEESEDRAAKGEAHVIRLKAPMTYPNFRDIVYGVVRNRKPKNDQSSGQYLAFEDPILLKSDGFPTYHLANVVDDHHMKITHVVRGAEWMSSTPKHLAMYDAFGWKPPEFAHVGLLLDKDRQKLSKRNFDLDISAFRDKMGIFPDTMTNFLALLGWSHTESNDVMNLHELIEKFSLKFTKGDSVVTLQKLWFLQKAHAERFARKSEQGDDKGLQLLLVPLKASLKELNMEESLGSLLAGRAPEAYLTTLLQADGRRYTNAPEFIGLNRHFFAAPDRETLIASRNPSSDVHHKVPGGPIKVPTFELVEATDSFKNISEMDWTANSIRKCIEGIVIMKTEDSLRENTKLAHDLDPELTRSNWELSWSKLIYRYLRWAIAGGLHGPDGARTMEILGRDETLRRLETAAKVLELEHVADDKEDQSLFEDRDLRR